MLKTGHDDSSPRWEQQPVGPVGQDVEATEIVPVAPPSAPATVQPRMPATTPRRDGFGRQLPVFTVVQAIVAALVLIGVSIAAFIVIRGPRVPTHVHVGPSIQISASGTAKGGTPSTTPSTAVAAVGPPPPAVIKFGGGGETSVTQQCDGTQALAALSLFLDNSGSTVPVDWWVSVNQVTPDGKSLWAVPNAPYGTLAAGKSTSVTLVPASNLCTQLAGRAAPVTYTADVDYGGVGGFLVTDIVMPGIGPSPTPTGSVTATSTP